MSLESPSKESILLSTAEKGKGATGEIRPLVKLTGEKTLFEGDEKAFRWIAFGADAPRSVDWFNRSIPGCS